MLARDALAISKRRTRAPRRPIWEPLAWSFFGTIECTAKNVVRINCIAIRKPSWTFGAIFTPNKNLFTTSFFLWTLNRRYRCLLSKFCQRLNSTVSHISCSLWRQFDCIFRLYWFDTVRISERSQNFRVSRPSVKLCDVTKPSAFLFSRSDKTWQWKPRRSRAG